MDNYKSNQLAPISEMTGVQIQEEWLDLCAQANELQLADDVRATFVAADVVGRLRDLMTEEVVNYYFIPLMGTRVGFLTDHDKPKDGKPQQPYPWQVVRDCIIDAACAGLAPIKNQFNIISGNMYPTKEGFTHLLKKIGVKYYITTSGDKSAVGAQTAEIECKIIYENPGDPQKKNFTYVAYPKKNAGSSLDQLKGKAERKAKKALYELITGLDLGDADEESSTPEDQETVVRTRREALRQTVDRPAVEDLP